MYKDILKSIGPGPKERVPDEIYVVVEIPKGSRNKYEIDDETGAVFLDRVLFSPFVYPADYGIIPCTLCEDGDPLDALVLVDIPNYPGTVIRARPVALLEMEDEEGYDVKVLAVPHEKIDPRFKEIRDLKDVPSHVLEEIKHFFEHYKDLEPNKWTRVKGWRDKEAAKREILKAIKLYMEKVGHEG